MKKIFLLFGFIQLIQIQVVKSQCGTTTSTYPGIGTTTINTVPIFINNNGCIQNSQITDNTDVSIATGSLDLSTITQSYKIGTFKFLWNNGNSTNIYGGVNTGNAGTFPTTDNTFYGYFTGNSVNTAIGNTFLGRYSGKTN
jgi:hypothetical protein